MLLHSRVSILNWLWYYPSNCLSTIEKNIYWWLSNHLPVYSQVRKVSVWYDLDDLILANDLSQIRDETGLVRMIEDVLDKNCKMVEQYLAGKEKALNALVGQVMKLSKGKANAQLVKEKILEKISKD